ncbi:MAG: hypothetical protein IJ640_10320 [Prevotella sp.]|nr:hypothetical protein [Prevotella sp.]
MEVLTLQIKRGSFKEILKGRQKTEHRFVYPRNAKQYLVEKENGDGTCDVEVVGYDALQLINGRKKDAPRLLVKVNGIKVIQMDDEKTGEPLTFVDNGETYYVTQMEYELGDVLQTENCEIFDGEE